MNNKNSPKKKSSAISAIKWLDLHFEESILIFFLVAISCVELVQVVARNVSFMPSLTWAEELCRFLWIATVFVSLPYTIRTVTALRVTALIELLPWKIENVINILIDVFTCAVLAVLAYFSIDVFEGVYRNGEVSPAMLLPMWIMYVFVVAGFSLGALRSLQMAIIHIKSINVPPRNSLDEQVEQELSAEKENIENIVYVDYSDIYKEDILPSRKGGDK